MPGLWHSASAACLQYDKRLVGEPSMPQDRGAAARPISFGPSKPRCQHSRSRGLMLMMAVLLSCLTTAVPVRAGDLSSDTFHSAALQRQMSFTVYLPDGYSTSGLQYPVLYLLHGAGGDETAWIEHGNIKLRADALIASAAIPPAIIVMPGCRACWWIDGAKDKAETAFWQDVVPLIASRFRTIEARDGRLIAGLSAGGYGAVRFAMKYPDRVGAVAALSPAVYSQTPPAASSSRVQPPFIGANGLFDQARWTAQNYPSLIDAYFDQPFRVPFYLMSGDHDNFGIAFETALLFKLVSAKQPERTELRVIDGDHSWSCWAKAMDDALTYVFRHAARPYKRLIVSDRRQG
jgi:enterochelin esterase-like enzyme